MDPLPLRLALVLQTTEDTATVLADDEPVEVAYAAVFPRPRTERVSPGHLVALAALPVAGRRPPLPVGVTARD